MAALSGVLTACALVPKGPVKPTGAGPMGALELGAYGKESEPKLRGAFEKEVAGRFKEGATIASAIKDLEANKFDCAASGAPKAKGGDPPDRVCRRTVKAEGCAYTWQAQLFDDDGGKLTLARVRGLYDKLCGADDLLGG